MDYSQAQCLLAACRKALCAKPTSLMSGPCVSLSLAQNAKHHAASHLSFPSYTFSLTITSLGLNLPNQSFSAVPIASQRETKPLRLRVAI